MTSIPPTAPVEREPHEIFESLALVTSIVDKASALVDSWDIDALVGATNGLTFGEASALAELRAAVTGSAGDYIETIALYAAQDGDALENSRSELRDIVDEHRDLWTWTKQNLVGVINGDGEMLVLLSADDIEVYG